MTSITASFVSRNGVTRAFQVSTPASRMFNISDADIIEAFESSSNCDEVVDWFLCDIDILSSQMEDFSEYVYDRMIELDLI